MFPYHQAMHDTKALLGACYAVLILTYFSESTVCRSKFDVDSTCDWASAECPLLAQSWPYEPSNGRSAAAEAFAQPTGRLYFLVRERVGGGYGPEVPRTCAAPNATPRGAAAPAPTAPYRPSSTRKFFRNFSSRRGPPAVPPRSITSLISVTFNTPFGLPASPIALQCAGVQWQRSRLKFSLVSCKQGA